jgi:large subunit ribosomal protein L29
MSQKIEFLKSLTSLSQADIKAKIVEDELRLKKLQFAHGIRKIENRI